MEEKVFVDREEELEALKQALNRQGAELIILYGRRRIGKTRLLHEIGKIASLDLAVMLEDADYSYNLKKLAEATAKRFNYPSFKPESFRELFEKLPENTTIAIDEYSYMANSAGEFQAIWEEVAKQKKLKIILSGSLIRIMEDLNYSLKSPLYGRATAILKLKPLKIQHLKPWYEKASFEDVLKVYFSVGGVPRYLEIIKTPSEEEIKKTFLDKNGLLLREGKLLLKESFPSSHIFPKVMLSIATGTTEASQIANNIGAKPNEIGKYLSILADYDLVEKRQPVLGGGKKDVRFYMADNFFAFWTAFVWPYYGELESGNNQNAIDKFNKNFNKYCGIQFEKAVIEMAPFPLKLEKVGKQWGKFKGEKGRNTYEIDIVGINEETKEILFAECKWQDNVDAVKVLEELKQKAEHVDWNKDSRKESYAVFAKSFSKKIKGVYLYDLKRMEKRT